MIEPIPAFLAHLPVQSGLPVPFVTGKSTKTGRYDFKVTHTKNHTLAQRFQLCGICGKHIAAPPYLFTVGPLCLQVRTVFEPPMHRPCAVAAFTMCPHLSRESWDRSEKDPSPGNVRAYELSELPPKPARLGLAFVPSYMAERNPENGMWYAFLPAENFPVEWWSYVDGKLQAEGQP